MSFHISRLAKTGRSSKRSISPRHRSTASKSSDFATSVRAVATRARSTFMDLSFLPFSISAAIFGNTPHGRRASHFRANSTTTLARTGPLVCSIFSDHASWSSHSTVSMAEYWLLRYLAKKRHWFRYWRRRRRVHERANGTARSWPRVGTGD